MLHVIGFALFALWPRQERTPLEPTFIDLQDMTELKATPEPQQQPVARPSDRRRRVARESSPRTPAPQLRAPEHPIPPPRSAQPAQRQVASPTQQPVARPAQSSQPRSGEQVTPGSSAGELLRRKPSSQQQTGGTQGAARPQLMPSASRMAKLEESYRRRFADDVADGDTRFLNTDDIQFGSFLRRFETAVYGVWRYPQEAALKGVEGVTPVKITFNRNGEIVNIKLLESSGSKILDDEVFRTLRMLGPMGNLPKNYLKDEFHLIAFFQYGNARSRLR